MVSQDTYIRTTISGVLRIAVEEIVDFEGMLHARRTITVQTENNERIDLVLETPDMDSLKLITEADMERDGWLKPKVYKGKSMHEEEMG